MSKLSYKPGLAKAITTLLLPLSITLPFVTDIFLFFASGDYLQWTFNGIRQFIPASILFACAGLIIKKKQ